MWEEGDLGIMKLMQVLPCLHSCEIVQPLVMLCEITNCLMIFVLMYMWVEGVLGKGYNVSACCHVYIVNCWMVHPNAIHM